MLGGKDTITVRLEGIDAPELGQSLGTQSKQALARLVGKVESDGDIRKAGQIIGRATGVKKEHAAAIFFFGFFE